MADYQIGRLMSGGLIVNYHCPSRCRHCLYRCSPKRSKAYMNAKTAMACFEKIGSMGCHSVHIGGGEPMMRQKELGIILDQADQAGIHIDYVETNSAWFKDEKTACKILESLKNKGLSTLLISISPFHIEYIPFDKVKGVMSACRKTGIQIFPWMETFISDLLNFDTETAHPLETVIDTMGDAYLKEIRNRYWVHPGGRALDTFRTVYPSRSLDSILNENPSSCSTELLDASHFHMDLYLNYIPGLCAGLALKTKDLGQPVDEDKYPLIALLMDQGINGLFVTAMVHGFKPSGKTYINKSDLCTDIRQYFAAHDLFTSELSPGEFYQSK